MNGFRRLLRGQANVGFVDRRTLWYRISGGLVVASLLGLIVFGLNLSIDFTGGTTVQVPNETGISATEMVDGLEAEGFDQVRVEELDDGAEIRVRTEQLTAEEELVFVEAVEELAGASNADAQLSSVGPTFGAAITRQALIALGVFLGVVVIFISWRFEFPMAVGALTALLHDLAITTGVYAIVGFEVTPATIVAVLTILGYSLYDTVVVYDTINENVEAADGRMPYADVVNGSINQVLVRSLMTSLTSLVPVGSLLFVGSLLLGASTLQEFALALFVGIAAGTYSSIFLAAPILVSWREWRGGDPERADARSKKRSSGGTYVSGGYASSRQPGDKKRPRGPRP
jgi:preprotein translocase subunit SecF